MTLDRINPFGNYEPANCRWATMEEQNNNHRQQWEAAHPNDPLIARYKAREAELDRAAAKRLADADAAAEAQRDRIANLEEAAF